MSNIGRFYGMALLAVVGAACAPHAGGPAVQPARDTVFVRDTVTLPGRADPGLEARVAALQLRALEQDGVLEDLQGRLDDAMREVVRAMAKLQSLATRAEAASAMAEADVATGQLRAAGGPAAEVAQAQHLLALSNAEFQDQNYGGAVYLANQAKSVATAGRGRLAGGTGTLRTGEVRFARPLRLEAAGRGNVREGPGTQFRVVFTVDDGAHLTAQSHLESWVQVQDDGGRVGWIFASLLRPAKR